MSSRDAYAPHPDVYAVIVRKGTGAQVTKLKFAEPVDALAGAIEYLRRGYHVRLNDRACEALAEGAGDLPAILRRLAASLDLAQGARS